MSIKKFSKRLRELRGKRSSLDAERGSGVRRAEILRYEEGEYYPSPDKLKKLAAFYQVPYSELRGLYFDETITDPEEVEAVKKWVLSRFIQKE